MSSFPILSIIFAFLHRIPLCAPVFVTHHILFWLIVNLFVFFFSPGKRRYDRKQSGFGGQTKPVFHKKVCSVSMCALVAGCTSKRCICTFPLSLTILAPLFVHIFTVCGNDGQKF